MKGVSESLAGRVGLINLFGFSLKEIKGNSLDFTPFLPTAAILKQKVRSSVPVSLKILYKLIWRGAYPAMALSSKTDRDLFYGSYVQTYLQRDIRDLAHVGNEMVFLRFLRAAAARTGQLLNISDLARDADIAPNTAKTWLSIINSSGIIYLLQPFHNNITKRLVKAPKLYFLDTGLCAYLTEWSSPETLEAGAISGAIYETWVMAEMLKSWLHNGLQPPFYYYRDKDNKEVDLLIVQDGKVYPLEFKKTSSPDINAARYFKALDKLKTPIGPGGVVCIIPEPLPLGQGVTAIPAGMI